MKRSGPELVVADAGPLIGLAIIGHLNRLRDLFHTIFIPGAVAAELCLGSNLPGASVLATASSHGWLRTVPVVDVPSHLLSVVDRGEAEAIVLAGQMGAFLLIDEGRGRVAAKSEQVPVFGTGAVLIRAKEQGFIREVRPSLDALSKANYRLSDTLREEILRLAGEGSLPGSE